MLIDILQKKSLLEKEFLFNISNKSNSLYSHFRIPKKNGGYRNILSSIKGTQTCPKDNK